MALAHLPNELLENIIAYTLPEGFEALALTSKHIYTLCAPFIKHHNKLRFQFQEFFYYKTDRVVKSGLYVVVDPPAYTACSAFNLMALIAVEPVIAHYIQEADFEDDSLWTKKKSPEFATNFDYDGAVIELLANSFYLKEAGIDWREYWAAIEEDIYDGSYSQHAAAFTLTLLPNAKTFKLPRWWKPIPATDKLIDTVIGITRQPCLPYDKPSIAQVSGFKAFGRRTSDSSELGFDISWAIPFLALPRVQSFHGFNCVGMSGHRSIVSKFLDSGFEPAVEVVNISHSSMDGAAIADFLSNTPRLRALTYSHMTDGVPGFERWDLCQFIMAIVNEAGAHLEALSVRIDGLNGSIIPGKISMHGFQSLQKLELPLEVVRCNITFSVSASHVLLLNDIIPASVSTLYLLSRGGNQHQKALEALFCDFAARKDDQAPALKEIYLSCPTDATIMYKEQCEKLATETEKAGVLLYLKPYY